VPREIACFGGVWRAHSRPRIAGEPSYGSRKKYVCTVVTRKGIAVAHRQVPTPSEKRSNRSSRLRKLLQAKDTQYLSLFDGLPIAICWVSREDQVLRCNRTLMTITGYSEPEISKCRPGNYSRAEDFKRLRQRAWASEERYFDGRILRKDGTFLEARLTASCFLLEGSAILMFSAIDITSQLQLQARLQQSKQALAEKEIALDRRPLPSRRSWSRWRSKGQAEERISANLQEVVLPLLKKLRLTETLPEYVDMLENHLQKISNTFGLSVTKIATHLSPREVEISSMVQGGMHSKQIAQLLNISYETVEKHRRNIRKKVGISGTQTNLTTFLQSNFGERQKDQA
jgi:PAS domain S-box-containing protein